MDFITTLKISNDNEHEKPKENLSKRLSNEQINTNLDQDGFDEQDESEDDPSQTNQRERRNPLPPR